MVATKRRNGYRQARWDEPLLSELSRRGRAGYIAPLDPEVEKWSAGMEFIPKEKLLPIVPSGGSTAYRERIDGPTSMRPRPS